MENNYIVFWVLLLSIIFYTLFRLIEIKKHTKKEIDLKENLFSDVEFALLGEDFKDLSPENNPFKTKRNKTIEFPIELIVNGQIIDENLKYIQKDYNWLINTLNKKGYYNVEDIKQAFLDSSGKVQVH